MAPAIVTSGLTKHVEDSEIAAYKDISRHFDYKLDEKTTKAKMVKSAKRIPFEVVEHSSSANLIFSLGSWKNVVFFLVVCIMNIIFDKLLLYICNYQIIFVEYLK